MNENKEEIKLFSQSCSENYPNYKLNNDFSLDIDSQKGKQDLKDHDLNQSDTVVDFNNQKYLENKSISLDKIEEHQENEQENHYIDSSIRLVTEPTIETPLSEPRNFAIDFNTSYSNAQDSNVNALGSFNYERSNLPRKSNFERYFKDPMQICLSKINHCMLSLCQNKLMTFMTFQVIFLVLKITNFLNEYLLLYIILSFGMIFILFGIITCLKRQRRLFNNSPSFQISNPIIFAASNSSEIAITSTPNEDILNRIVLSEIRLNNLRNQLALYMYSLDQLQRRNDTVDVNSPLIGYFGSLLLTRELIELGELDFQNNNYNSSNGLSQQQIDDLPCEKYKFVGDNQINSNNSCCTICLEDFKQDDELRKFLCNHKFHKKCIDDWLLLKNVCPNCKCLVH